MSSARLRRIDEPDGRRVTYWGGATWRNGTIVSRDNFGKFTVLGDDGGYYYGMSRREIRLPGEHHSPPGGRR